VIAMPFCGAAVKRVFIGDEIADDIIKSQSENSGRQANE
jgi:hypothetical protein